MIIVSGKLPIRLLKGTIVDVETTHKEPSYGELVTIGYISGDELWIFQKEPYGPDVFADDPFNSQIPSWYIDFCPSIIKELWKEKMSKKIESIKRIELLKGPSLIELLKELPRPFMAYNKSFEERWLKIKFDIDLMKPWENLAKSIPDKVPYRLAWLVHERPLIYWVAHVIAMWAGNVVQALKDESMREYRNIWSNWLSAYEQALKKSKELIKRFSLFINKDVPSLWNEAKKALKEGRDPVTPLCCIIIHNISDLLRSLFLYIINGTLESLIVKKRLQRAAFKARLWLLSRCAQHEIEKYLNSTYSMQ